MAHVALLCLPFYSHLRVFEAVAGALASRGHKVSLVVNQGARRFVRDDALSVFEVGGSGSGHRDPAEVIRRAARPNGPFGILRTVEDTAALTEAFCRDGPALLRRIEAEAVVGDQMEPAAGLLAASLGLPFVTLATAVPIDRAPGIPLPFLDWPFDPSERGLKRNRGGEKVARLLLRRQRRTIARWSQRFGLGERRDLEDCLSGHLRIAQTVPGFDFPRPPEGPLHAVGPIRTAREGTGELAFAPEPHRPVVFASFGTLQGHRLALFQLLAEACRPLGVSLVVAHCGGLSPREAATIDAAHVTDFLPQRAILSRADVCVTHAGLNTVLDSLEAGVPLLALPIAFDQRGVAARVAHHGVGESIRHDRATVAGVRQAISRLIEDRSYRERIEPIRREIRGSKGLAGAVELIDAFLAERAQVERPAAMAS